MERLMRVVDANFNRGREGLRVMEDVARFVLDRGDLSERVKVLRHEVSGAVGGLGDVARRVGARDTEGDVGTGIETASEYRRQGVRELVLAASGRAGEALRVLEEAAKALGKVESARRLERARYSLYSLEKELVLALPSGRGRQWKLCVLVTEALCVHHSWHEVVTRSLAGGADCIQLREKEMEGGELLVRARWLVEACRGKASVIVNDRADVAALAGADGVHLGQGDLPVAEARRIVGSEAVIGISASSLEMVRAAVGAGADYVGLGPMFATITKTKDVLVGPGLVREVLADEGVRGAPHLAIGGIGVRNVSELSRVGVRGVAVSSAVCGAGEPERVCAELVAAMG